MSDTPDGVDVVLLPGATLERSFDYTQRIMIAGVVFNDLNANGTKDSNERGVNGRRICVDLNHNALIDANEPAIWPASKGLFGFEDLVAGTYVVRAKQIPGWRNEGSGARTITLGSGGVLVNVQFGQQRVVVPPAMRGMVIGIEVEDPLPPIVPQNPVVPLPTA